MALTDADRLHMVAMALMRYSVVTVKAGESLINYNKKLTPMNNLALSTTAKVYSPDITPGQSYFAYSSSGSYAADRAFDDNASTYWQSTGTSTNENVGVDFTIARIVKLISITNYNSYGIKDFTFEGSNNGSDWDELFSGTAQNSGYPQYFQIDNNNAYRYYRIKNNGTPYYSSYIRIVEIEMREEE